MIPGHVLHVPPRPPHGTVQQVQAWVAGNPRRAQLALDSERAGQQRSSLISHLDGLLR